MLKLWITFLVLNQIIPIHFTMAQTSVECPTCSSNSKNLQDINDHLKKLSTLTDEEKSEIIKARKKLVEKTIIPNQTRFYSDQYNQFNKLVRAHESLFKNSDEDSFFKNIDDVKTLDEMTQKLDSSKIADKIKLNNIAILKTASEQMWYRDAELKAMMKKQYKERSADKRMSYFGAQAKKAINSKNTLSEMDAVLTQAYLEQKSVKLNKGIKKRSSLNAKELENLKVNFAFDTMKAVIINPTDKQLSKMSHSDLLKLEQSHLEKIYSRKPLYCKSVTATQANLNRELGSQTPPNADSSPSPGTPEPQLPTVEFTDFCDLNHQTFDDNNSEVDKTSVAKINQCLEKAKNNPNCANGVERISAEVKSCASTLRTSTEKTNADLAEKRANATKEAFERETKSVLGITATVSRDNEESRATYENSYYDENGNRVFTGTCGPRPPKIFGVENWMPSSTEFCKNDPPRFSVLEDCVANIPATESWKCRPKAEVDSYIPDSVNNKISKEKFQDYYRQFRRASLQITYSCKTPTKNNPPSNPSITGIAFDETQTPPKTITQNSCGVFFKCFFPKASLQTADKSADTSIGLFDNIPGPSRPKGKGIYECPVFNH